MTPCNTPPICPLHKQPMRSRGILRDGREVFECIVTKCSIEIDVSLSQPAAPDPLHTDDPAEMTDPEL